MVTQSVSQCLLDHFPEDRFELVFVEGGGGPWDDPVDPVRLLETVHGSLCLASLVAGRPQPHPPTEFSPVVSPAQPIPNSVPVTGDGDEDLGISDGRGGGSRIQHHRRCLFLPRHGRQTVRGPPLELQDNHAEPGELQEGNLEGL